MLYTIHMYINGYVAFLINMLDTVVSGGGNMLINLCTTGSGLLFSCHWQVLHFVNVIKIPFHFQPPFRLYVIQWPLVWLQQQVWCLARWLDCCLTFFSILSFISCDNYRKAQGLKFWGEGEGCGLALTMFYWGDLASHIHRPIQQYNI